MKKILLLIFLITFLIGEVYSQKPSAISKVIYKVWVDTGKGANKSYLATVSDSAVYTSDNPVPFTPDVANTNEYARINYTSIKTVRIVKKGSSGKGFLTGLLTGTTAGAMIGLASGDDKNCFICFTQGEKALFHGLSFGAIAGITGAIIGLKEKKFKINGQKINFDDLRQYLQKGVKYSSIKTP